MSKLATLVPLATMRAPLCVMSRWATLVPLIHNVCSPVCDEQVDNPCAT